MVIVTTGGGFMMDDIAQYLVASITDLDRPLAADPGGVAKLAEAVELVKQPPQPTALSALPEIAQQISGKTYAFQPNPATLESVALEFDGSAEATVYIQAGGSPLVSHPVGLDGVFRFSPGPDGRPSAYRGSWIAADTFLLEYDGITNNDHSFIQVRFAGNQAQLSIQETAHEGSAQLTGQME